MKIPKSLDQLKPIPHPLVVGAHSPSPHNHRDPQHPLSIHHHRTTTEIHNTLYQFNSVKKITLFVHTSLGLLFP